MKYDNQGKLWKRPYSGVTGQKPQGSAAHRTCLICLDGIRGVVTHIFAERFSGEIASYRAANLIYMASCLLTGTPYERIDSFEEYAGESLTQADLKVLSNMRKAQPLQYAYLVKADRLLRECR